jgi:CubicO group peptidase (beta-lactamase class C family)
MSSAKHLWRADRLKHLKAVIQDDIARDRYNGAVLIVARGGEIAFQEAIGSHDQAQTRALAMESVFSIFSVTKAITNVLVFRAIELGLFALTSKICDIIPEFATPARAPITIFDLLTHSSGLPPFFTPKPGMNIDVFDEVLAAIYQVAHPISPPGVRVEYSPMANHALLGEAVRRTDPARRSYRQIVQDEIFTPLKMKDSSIGRRKDLAARHVIPDFRDLIYSHPSTSNLGPNGAFEEENAEMPWVGAVCSVPDLFRFAEMLRRGGELDGARILSPAIIELARRNWTGNEKPNELYATVAYRANWRIYPAYMGLGFALRGPGMHHALYGTLASPETFGNYGAGSSLFWVDPVRDITFAFLSAGVMASDTNIERFQRLSDIAISAAI